MYILRKCSLNYVADNWTKGDEFQCSETGRALSPAQVRTTVKSDSRRTHPPLRRVQTTPSKVIVGTLVLFTLSYNCASALALQFSPFAYGVQ